MLLILYSSRFPLQLVLDICVVYVCMLRSHPPLVYRAAKNRCCGFFFAFSHSYVALNRVFIMSRKHIFLPSAFVRLIHRCLCCAGCIQSLCHYSFSLISRENFPERTNGNDETKQKIKTYNKFEMKYVRKIMTRPHWQIWI